MTKSEAEKKLNISGNAIIRGVPIGARFSEEQYNHWLQDTKKVINITDVRKHSLDLVVTEGDREVIKAWADCMKARRSGLLIRFEPIDWEYTAIRFNYIPPSQAPTAKAVITSKPIIIGASVIQGLDLMKPGTEIPALKNEDVVIKRDGKGKVIVSIKNNVDDWFGYLPKIVELPPIITKRQIEWRIRGGPNLGPSKTWINIGETQTLFKSPAPDPYNQNPYHATCTVAKDFAITSRYVNPWLKEPAAGNRVLSKSDGCSTVTAQGLTVTCCPADDL